MEGIRHDCIPWPRRMSRISPGRGGRQKQRAESKSKIRGGQVCGVVRGVKKPLVKRSRPYSENED